MRVFQTYIIDLNIVDHRFEDCHLLLMQVCSRCLCYQVELFMELSLDMESMNGDEQLSLYLIEAVLQVIRHQVTLAKDDLLLASQESPLYPALMSLRYLLRYV